MPLCTSLHLSVETPGQTVCLVEQTRDRRECGSVPPWCIDREGFR